VLLIVVMALVGLALYGSIVLLAKLFGGRSRGQEDRRQCVFCQNMTPGGQDRCDWCGRDLRSPLAEELIDLEALERQLGRFRQRETLKPAVVANLLARVERYRRGLVEPPTEQPAAAPGSPFAAPAIWAAGEEPVVAQVVVEPSKVKPAKPRTTGHVASPARPPQAPARPERPKPEAPARPAKPKPEAPSVAPLARRGPQPPAASRPEPRPAAAAGPEPRPPAPPPAPRRSWAEMLAGFMEERNIRWGELIGGLLIVGSSVALVLSLWQTLKGIPHFPFIIFVASSSAVFGVGLYAHHRWKLESTSRGLLVIATLLVPLNFLFMALSSQGNWDPITVAAGLTALGIFTWLVGWAGRVLVPGGRWLLAVAVVGSSAAVLLCAWWNPGQSAGWRFVAAGCLPAVLFSTAVGCHLYRPREERPVDAAGAAALFTLLGTATFALLIAFGLLASQAGDLNGVRAHLSLPVALAAVAILACGLTVTRKIAPDVSLAAYHTAGTTIALVGMLAMLVALGLAWPRPLGIIAVGTLNCAALVFAAFYYRMPALHAGAIACGALAYLTGFHVVYPSSELGLLAGGEDLWRDMLRLTTDASSGTALGGLFVLLGLVAEGLARRGLRRHGMVYAGGSLVVAVAGLLLVTVHGLATPPDADALRAMVLYAVYGAGSLALAARWRRAELSYLGLGLLTAASTWLLWWQKGQIEAVWATVLAGEALLFGGIAELLRRRVEHPPATAWREQLKALRSGPLVELYRLPLLHAAETVAAVALTIGLLKGFSDQETLMPVVTSLSLAVLCFLLAWTYRSPARTWAGSMLVLAGLVHTLWFNYHQWIGQPRLSLLIALLAHCTLAVAAGVLLDTWTKSRSDGVPGEAIGRVFSQPLADTALLSSALAVPVLAWELLTGTMLTWSLASCLFWLAAVWLVISWRSRHAHLFAAHQVVLALAVLTATTALLKQWGWVTSMPSDLLDAQNLQAHTIGLGLLSLLWIIARIALRNDEVGRKLLNPHGASVDRIIRHAVVGFQFLLIGWCLLPGFGEELLPQKAAATVAGVQQGASSVPDAASGLGAWMVLGVMAAVLIATLWYRWRISMVSSLLLAATIPCLIAGQGRFVDNQAVASALRWGSAVCFVACSVAVWQRKRLLQTSAQARAKVDVGPQGPSAARATLLATTAAPVLVLTILAALVQLVGETPGGPAANSFFDRIGDNLSYLVPLMLVMLGLVGYAVRERSAGYAFSAGLVAELTVTLGYALHVATDPDPARKFGTAELVTLIQLATITAALWAGAWLAVRQWLNVWREAPQPEGSQPASARLLMNVQLVMGIAGNSLLLIVALLSLALFDPDSQAWTVAAGSPLGWIALASLVAAGFYRQMQLGRPLNPNVVGLTGMAALGLLACTIRGVLPQWGYGTQWGYGPEWGYRTLMLGWAAYALLIVLATWWAASVRTLPGSQGPPQALIRAAAVWVRVAGLAAALLGLKAAVWHHEEQLWAAAAIATASAAGAAMGVWRRQEGWAFSAALGVNLAASLVVWHFQRTLSFEQWWLRLVQANVIASSAVAIVWLAARRRLYQLRELTLGTSPLLATQTAIPVAGNAILLVVPVVWLVLQPADLAPWTTRLMAQLA
ncbi:MAG: hypothetical protein ACYSWU_07275, partial [Planctomycetota bacterium]